MAEETLMVASAVVVPDPEPSQLSPGAASPPENGSLKRRQSSASDDANSKRPRLSTEKSNNDSNPSQPADAQPRLQSAQEKIAARRANRDLEERKRGQRLFGGLLNTLSQSTSSTTQKRRADIEKKQQVKLKQREEEFDQKQRERYEKLMNVRRREQRKWEEEGMRVRHEGLRAQAGFLRTRTEPVLFYKPWELRPDEEDQIRDQIDDTEAIIDRELDAFERRREEERVANGDLTPDDDGQDARQRTNGNDAMDTDQPNPSREKSTPKHAVLEEEQRNGPEPQGQGTPAPSTTDTNAPPEPANHQPADQGHHPEQSTTKDEEMAIDTNGMTSVETDAGADATGKVRRGSIEDNGEVILEGDEDTVIY